MYAQPLFLDNKLEFAGLSKMAGSLTKLDDNVDLWPQDISQEAYKRLPYLSNYEVNVILDKIDEERGYGFGSVDVRPRSDASYKEGLKLGNPRAQIPVVIKDGMLSPFDVFVCDGRYYHLTESRLNESLFRPATFDVARDRPPEYSMAQDLLPPALSATGFGIGGTKFASIPILPQLNGRVLKEHADRFMGELTDPSTKVACSNAHEGVKAAILSAAGLACSDPIKTAEAAWRHVKPDVVQLRKLSTGNYLLKWANTDMWAPQEEVVSPEAAAGMASGTSASPLVEEGATITASPESSAQALMAEGVKVVDGFGIWTVQDKNGNSMTGWCFPQVSSFDLHPLPIMLFTNGSVYALQDQIVGKLVGRSNDLPKSSPSGYGCLYMKGSSPVVITPVTVNNTATGPDGRLRFMGERDTGEPLSFSFSDDVKTLAAVGNGEYLVPSTYSWMPLNNEVKLVDDPSLFVKTASRDWSKMVEIVGDGQEWTFKGGPIAKVAERHTKFLNRNDAEFLGVSLGMRQSIVKEALDKASRGSRVEVWGCRSLGSASEKLAAARQKIQHELNNLGHPIRNYLLLKEASILDDAMAADRILGLGFINAENISTFVDMLPALDETSSRIAEMLVASRLGLKDIPESSLERMLVALEDVIKGLKTLRQNETPL